MQQLVAANAFFLAYGQADFLGKLIFLALYTLSIVSWVLIIHKVWMTSTVRRQARVFQERFYKKRRQPLALELGSLPQKREFPHPFRSVYSTVKTQTLEILSKNRLEKRGGGEQTYLSPADLGLVEAQADVIRADQTKLLEKHLFILSTVVHLSPLLGLLGTVWGITITFSELQGHAAASTNQLVLGGLSMALATTVLGLVVAIPALIGNSYLRNTIRDFSTDMENFSQEVLNAIEIHYRKVDVD